MAALNEEQQSLLWKAVFGNGQPGLSEQVRGNTRAIASLMEEIRVGNSETHEELRNLNGVVRVMADNALKAEAKAEGRLETIRWLRWILGVAALLVTLSAAVGTTRLVETLNAVNNVLRDVPTIPE